MILIVTHKKDFTVDFVVDKLNRSEIPYTRLNCEDIDLDPYYLKFGKTSSFQLLNLTKFKSVWFRRLKVPELPQHLGESDRNHLLSDYYSLFQNILLSLDVKWLSYPTNVYAAENKLLQLKNAAIVGFNVPDTLITNDKDLLIEFYNKMEGNVIIKPINSNRIVDSASQKLIFTNPLAEQYINNLSEYNLTPCIYQEYISKQYELRVTVVDEKVFAASVHSQVYDTTKVDWRREKIPFVKYSLPNNIRSKCLSLVKTLGLKFGAIDLIKNTNGDYYFLEINPNGQWAWIETDTGLNISDAIINYLK